MIDVAVTVLMAASWFLLWVCDRFVDPLPAREAARWACGYIVGGAVLAAGTGLWTGGISICIAVWLSHVTWQRRKRLRRRPSTVSGIVRDLGHRLTVSSA